MEKKIKVLIVGSGGREHALAWKIQQSPRISALFVAPGNAGTALCAQNVDISAMADIVQWTQNNKIDLVVIGPDNYLADGITDLLTEKGIAVFGPTRSAAEIEWSKAYAKRFMEEEGIPTARFRTFTRLGDALGYVRSGTFPVVIKVSGLALGKGVVVAENAEEAEQALWEIMEQKVHGDAGNEVVVEEFLQGIEISVHAFCDGNDAMLFPAAQDHKRAYDGDVGPNTGGMGTVTPVRDVTDDHLREIKEKIVLPTLAALKKRGRPFCGVLFPGVMLTGDGPKVIEFNARFGDPETQTYMRLLETDLVEILLACVEGRMKRQVIRWSDKSACCVVAASGGYPGPYQKGRVIRGLEKDFGEDSVVFHAGTKREDDQLVTNSGRVLGVTATGVNLSEALSKTYAVMGSINFEGMHYRRDVGVKSKASE